MFGCALGFCVLLVVAGVAGVACVIGCAYHVVVCCVVLWPVALCVLVAVLLLCMIVCC